MAAATKAPPARALSRLLPRPLARPLSSALAPALALALALPLLAGCVGNDEGATADSPGGDGSGGQAGGSDTGGDGGGSSGSSGSGSSGGSGGSSCCGGGPGGPGGEDDGTMAIHGQVVDTDFLPVAGANVTVVEAGLVEASDGEGRFAFDPLPDGIYLVTANATGYVEASLTATPEAAAEGLTFILDAAPSGEPKQEQYHLEGFLQCASETLIMSGSCDAIVAYANGQLPPGYGLPEPFEGNHSVEFPVEAAWRTVVLDVDFSPDDHPGIEGLRITVQGLNDLSETGVYEQYGRWSGSGPFTARIEPGGEYPDGVGPVPENATSFRVTAYPHGHGWHAVCNPQDGQCFLGVGAAIDLKFDVYVTIFYNQPAPEGWSLFNEQ